MSYAPHAHSSAAQDDPRSFRNEFHEILQTLAIPMFHEFASDAIGNGFPATEENGVDVHGNPFAAVRFVLDRRAQIGVDASEECEFIFTGLLSEEKIDLLAAYDKRPGKEARYHEQLEIQQINQVKLEDQLTDFLAAAMASRRDQPIPPRKAEQAAMTKAGVWPLPDPATPAASAPIPIVWKKREK